MRILKIIVAVVFSLLSLASLAKAERLLTGSEVLLLLSDATLISNKEGKNIKQIFQKGGMTLYIENGAQSQGLWKIDGDKYCSQWPPSEIWSCFAMTRDGSTIIFNSANGTRYLFDLPSAN